MLFYESELGVGVRSQESGAAVRRRSQAPESVTGFRRRGQVPGSGASVRRRGQALGSGAGVIFTYLDESLKCALLDIIASQMFDHKN